MAASEASCSTMGTSTATTSVAATQEPSPGFMTPPPSRVRETPSRSFSETGTCTSKEKETEEVVGTKHVGALARLKTQQNLQALLDDAVGAAVRGGKARRTTEI